MHKIPNPVVYGRTILLVVQSGFGARYLLRTDILSALRRAGVRPVILTPNASEEYFRKEFIDCDVVVEKLQADACARYIKGSRVQKILRRVRLQSQRLPEANVTIGMARKLLRDTGGAVGLATRMYLKIEDAMVWLVSRFKILRRLMTWTEQHLFVGHFHRDIFEKYRPAVVVTTSLGYWHPDEFVMREARYHKARVVPVILSWDNTSSYGMAAVPPDYTIAWTEVMKRELVDYHDMPPERVFVGGVAHFDMYHYPKQLMPRETLCLRFGLEPSQKILFFATKSPNSYPWNSDVVEQLAQAVERNEFDSPCQILVRLHPIYYRYRNGDLVYQAEHDKLERLAARYPFVRINHPEIISQTLSMDSSRDEMILLGSILKNAHVLINLFSTVSIEASIFDLPVVNVAYEGDPRLKRKPRDSIDFDEAQTHNQRVIRTGGVSMARNPSELIKYINAYLKNPRQDQQGRMSIRNQECGPFPGRAGETIGGFLADLAHQNSSTQTGGAVS
jgi:hypothetical protein